MDFLATPARRKVLFGALYLSEGAPIGYIWWALPTLLGEAGVPVQRITALTALLVLPWTFKFLWAPLVDSFRTPRWGFRGWIVASQGAMGLLLLPLLSLDLERDFALVGALLFAHAMAAATQDVAVDGLAIASVPVAQRGAINGWMQAGMLVGRSAFGGIALLAERRFGLAPVLLSLVGVAWISLVLVLLCRPAETRSIEAPARAFVGGLRRAAASRNLWAGLAFAGLSGAAFEAAGAVAGPFLLSRGVAQESIGWIFALPVPAGMIAGALAGGYLSDRIGRRKAAGLFLVLMVTGVVTLAAVGAAGTAAGTLLAVFALNYVLVGLFTAATYALFMDLTEPGMGATQFSAYMGATNGCEAWSGFAAGRLAAGPGYPSAFLAAAVVSLVSLPLLLALRPASSPPAADHGGRGAGLA